MRGPEVCVKCTYVPVGKFLSDHKVTSQKRLFLTVTDFRDSNSHASHLFVSAFFLSVIHLLWACWWNIICRQISLTCGRSPEGAPYDSVQVRILQISSPRLAIAFIGTTLLNTSIYACTHTYTQTHLHKSHLPTLNYPSYFHTENCGLLMLPWWPLANGHFVYSPGSNGFGVRTPLQQYGFACCTIYKGNGKVRPITGHQRPRGGVEV
jgi:hypothetical protein